jgi:hypothetical protein
MKTKLVENIKTIISDLDYYKTSRDFVQTITNIEPNLFQNLFSNLITNIDSYSDEEIKKLNTILNSFITNNKKKYLKKIPTKDWIVYEYLDCYIWHILNKKINITDTYSFLFKTNKIEQIYIDNIKRSENLLSENILNDIAYSEKTRIIVKK